MKSNIKGRFAISLAVNVVKALLGFATGMIMAKGLGVVDYGRFSFLLATFMSFMSLLDMGTSNAFYTFISKKKQISKFYYCYLSWMLTQFLTACSVIYLFTPSSIFTSLFLGEARNTVLIAFIATFFQLQIWNLLSQLAEASRDTAKIQKLNLSVSIFNFIIITLLYYIKEINIEFIFYLIIIQYFSAVIIFIKTIFNSESLVDNCSDDIFSPSALLIKFKEYCAPLFVYSWFVFGYKFFDAWLLQFFGGSEQQAYFAVGAKIAAISLIFTTSLLRILWKEIADAEQQDDKQKVYQLYFRTTRTLYFVSVSITAFILPWASDIIELLLGVEYKHAAIPFAIMLFYPIHQSLGQISGTMFYAIEETKVFSKLGVFSMVFSSIVAYIVLSDGYKVIPGYSLGALGLSLKMVLTQIISVNLALFFIARIRGWAFDWFYQIYMLAMMVGGGYFCYFSASWFDIHLYLQFFIAGILYILFTLIFIYFFSSRLFYIERKHLISVFKVSSTI